MLAREFVRLNHQVTVFAAAGSETCGELVPTLPGTYGVNGSPGDWHVCEWINHCKALEHSARLDVLHMSAIGICCTISSFSALRLEG